MTGAAITRRQYSTKKEEAKIASSLFLLLSFSSVLQQACGLLSGSFGSNLGSGSSNSVGSGSSGVSYFFYYSNFFYYSYGVLSFSSFSVLSLVAAGYHCETCDHSERKE